MKKLKTMQETNELIARGNAINEVIMKAEKNENIPITGCPEGKIMLFYFWNNDVLESIWATDEPIHSVAKKVVDGGTPIYKKIAHEPDKNYIRHLLIDDKDVHSLIIWLYMFNGLSYSYRSVVPDPYFIPEKILGDYLKVQYSVKKNCAKVLVANFMPAESWGFSYYGEPTLLYPKWAVHESMKRFKESSEKVGMNIASVQKSSKEGAYPKNYILDGIVFSRPFGRKIGMICDSLYVPFTKETVTIELLKEYVTISDLYHVDGMLFTSVQNFLKELKEHDIFLKEEGPFSLSRKNVNPFGIEKEELLDMTYHEASREYFSDKAQQVFYLLQFERCQGSYGEVTLRKVLDGLTVEAIRKTRGTREPGISKFIEELKMAGIELLEN